jgi:FixJ family two-component response regulator
MQSGLGLVAVGFARRTRKHLKNLAVRPRRASTHGRARLAPLAMMVRRPPFLVVTLRAGRRTKCVVIDIKGTQMPPSKPITNTAYRADPVVHLVHANRSLSDDLSPVVQSVGLGFLAYTSPGEFIAAQIISPHGCLLLDVNFPELNDPAFEAALLAAAATLPVILVMQQVGITCSIRRLKSAAVDFLLEPFERDEFVESVTLACEEDFRGLESRCELARLQARYASLTNREKQVLAFVCEGLMNKQAAAILNLSVITVKVHRATMMRKMRCRRLVDLIRLADALHIGNESRVRQSHPDRPGMALEVSTTA